MRKYFNIFVMSFTVVFLNSFLLFAQTPVSDWGGTNRNAGAAWPILNDTTTTPGNASMGGSPMATTDWGTIRGGFDPMAIPTDQALIVTGQMEWVGGDPGNSYLPVRYALTFQDDSNVLNYQYTDSAKWSSTSGSYGWEFCPKSGTEAGPGNTNFTIINGGWNSTFSNGGTAIANVNQVPALAPIVAAKYNFMISVQAVSDTTCEMRWSLISEDGESYWWGGKVVDTLMTDSLNGICFGLTGEHVPTVTQFNLIDVQVAEGPAPEVPLPPFQAHYVSQWGGTNRNAGAAWPILNDATTLSGNAGMGGSPMATTDWGTIRGGFDYPVAIPTDQAVIVTGKMEWVGGDPGNSYLPVRYALTYQDDNNVLNYQYTDSAKWSSTSGSYGWEFCPKSGTEAGPGNTNFSVINGGWNSTFSNGGSAIANINQVPSLAPIVAGKYNFMISVQALSATSCEMRWSLISEDGESYWWGGKVVDTLMTDKLNGICFGLTGEHVPTVTQFNLIDVHVDEGPAPEVPLPPFQAHYVSQWGGTNRNAGAAWPILNDATTLAGNAGMGGSPMATTDWGTIRGGFDHAVAIPTDQAVIVTGKMEWVGGDPGNSYLPVRYALTYQDDNNVLNYQNTDSAMWSSTSGSYGWEFCPKSGTEAGPGNTNFSVINGGWNSTFSNGGSAIANINQVPSLAPIVAGKYNFMISVQALSATSCEMRWSLISEDGQSYWWGGKVVDTLMTDKLNGICFGLTGEHVPTVTQFNLIDVHVDEGPAPEVPLPPFQAHYVSQWGGTNRNAGAAWPILNDATTLAGNAGMGGNGPIGTSDWATIRGGFDHTVAIPTDQALLVTGQMEWVGGDPGDSYLPVRYALTYQDDNNVLNYQNTDSAMWSSTSGSYGWEFCPRSGTEPGPGATNYTVINGGWNSTFSNGGSAIANVNQFPLVAPITAGVYNFAIGVQAVSDTSCELRWNLYDKDKAHYVWGGTVIDTLPTDRINGICFGLTGEHVPTVTQFNLIDVHVDEGTMFEPILTEIGNNTDAIPVKYTLNQNYPNPFNPATTIKFGLPERSNVKLQVYNLLGQVVAELTNKKMEAGYHEISFDASKFSSGVYFYKLEAGNFVSVKKMMLLK